MPGLGGDAELEQLFFHVVHVGGDPLLDASEVLVLQLLTLGRRGAHHGPAAQDQVRALVEVIRVDEEILLLRSQGGIDAPDVLAPQQLHDIQGAFAHRPVGAEQRGLLVQGFAGVGKEGGGDAQGRGDAVAPDEGRGGHVPDRVAPGLEGGPDAAAGEARGVRFALDKLLARKPFDDGADPGDVDEGVVLFRRHAGHGLEPVGEVGGPLLDRPLLHGVGYDVGGFDVQKGAFVDGIDDLPVGGPRELDLHDVDVEGVFPVIGGYGHVFLLHHRIGSLASDNRARLFHKSSL